MFSHILKSKVHPHVSQPHHHFFLGPQSIPLKTNRGSLVGLTRFYSQDSQIVNSTITISKIERSLGFWKVVNARPKGSRKSENFTGILPYHPGDILAVEYENKVNEYNAKRILKSNFIGESNVKYLLLRIPGIGKKLATAFISHHGKNVGEKLKEAKANWEIAKKKNDKPKMNEITSLLLCPKFSSKKVQHILNSHLFDREPILLIMHAQLIPATLYVNISERALKLNYSKEEIIAILPHPYQMYLKGFISLDDADKIAFDKGVAKADPLRIEAHIHYFLMECGNTRVPISEVPEGVLITLGDVSTTTILEHLLYLQSNSSLNSTPSAHLIDPNSPESAIFGFMGNFIYLTKTYQQELKIYNSLKRVMSLFGGDGGEIKQVLGDEVEGLVEEIEQKNEINEINTEKKRWCEGNEGMGQEWETLTKEQKWVLSEILCYSCGVVTGSIGTGKTFLLSYMSKLFESMEYVEVIKFTGKFAMYFPQRKYAKRRILLIDDCHLLSVDNWDWIFTKTNINSISHIYLFGDLNQFDPFPARRHIFQNFASKFPNLVFRLPTPHPLNPLSNTAYDLLHKKPVSPSSSSVSSFEIFLSPTPTHPSHLPLPPPGVSYKEFMIFVPNFDNIQQFNEFCQSTWNNGETMKVKGKGENDVIWKVGDRFMWEGGIGDGDLPVAKGTIGYIAYFVKTEQDTESEFVSSVTSEKYTHVAVRFQDRNYVYILDAPTLTKYCVLAYVLPCELAFGMHFDEIIYYLPTEINNSANFRLKLYSAISCAHKKFSILTPSKKDLDQILDNLHFFKKNTKTIFQVLN